MNDASMEEAAWKADCCGTEEDAWEKGLGVKDDASVTDRRLCDGEAAGRAGLACGRYAGEEETGLGVSCTFARRALERCAFFVRLPVPPTDDDEGDSPNELMRPIDCGWRLYDGEMVSRPDMAGEVDVGTVRGRGGSAAEIGTHDELIGGRQRRAQSTAEAREARKTAAWRGRER